MSAATRELPTVQWRRAGPAPTPPAPRLLAAVSGKGGVGKTNLIANLAIAAAGLGSRALVVDGDLGLANVDVLLGLAPELSVADVLSDRCRLDEALVRGPRGIRILPAASGRRELSALEGAGLRRLQTLLLDASRNFDLVLIDAGAGIGPAVTGLAALCDPILTITTPEPTSLTDAYATLKVMRQVAPTRGQELLVNEARDETEARATHLHLDRVARRFLGAGVAYRGFLPRDTCLGQAVATQRAVVEAFPNAPISKRIVELARTLLPPAR